MFVEGFTYPTAFAFAGSLFHSAARQGHCSGGTFRWGEELLRESAGKLLPATAGAGSAGRKACAQPETRLPALQGQPASTRQRSITAETE